MFWSVIDFFPLFFEHKSLLEKTAGSTYLLQGKLIELSLVFGKSKGIDLNVKLIRLANLKNVNVSLAIVWCMLRSYPHIFSLNRFSHKFVLHLLISQSLSVLLSLWFYPALAHIQRGHIKGMLHPKIKLLSSFTHPHVVPDV